MARPLSTEGFTQNGRPLTVKPEKSIAEKVWTGISDVVGSVQQPFVSLAAKPVQLATKALGVQDPFAQGVPGGLPAIQDGKFTTGGTNLPVSKPTVSGTAGDILRAGATAAGIVGAPTSVPAALATGAAVGAGTFAGQALQEEKPLQEVAKQGLIGGAIGSVASGVTYGLGKLVEAVGGKILKSVIKPTKPDIEDGFSMDTIKKYNLGGSLDTIKNKTQTKLTEISNQLNAKLAESPSKIDLNKVLDSTVKELTDSSKLKGFGANVKIENALASLKEEVNLVNANGGISIPEAQIVKQAAGGFGAWQYGRTDPESKATEIIYNTFYNKLKNAIEDASPDGVRSLNQELSKLIPVMNAIIRRLPVAERSNIISLNEMIGLVGSTVSPVALGPTLLAIISRSGAAGQAALKAGPAISSAAAPASLLTAQTAEQITDTER